MAIQSLTLLLDDIASLLDDVATLTKVATKKTAGVLGDDLALNAQQVAGVRAARELPVVWAVAKGSFLNKAIIVPVALILSAFTPWLIIPLLMIGGGYLCFEGFEKIAHRLFHGGDGAGHEKADLGHDHIQALTHPEVDLVALERDKIRGAIRTDFILSTEIIVITLGTVAAASFTSQVAVLVGIAVIMTVGVYGLVGGIVKLDDGGLALTLSKGQHALARMKRSFGRFLLSAAPYLMKGLSIAGTIAMFTVGGSILVHGVHALGEIRDQATAIVGSVPNIGGGLAAVTPIIFEAAFGVLAGALLVAIVSLAKWLWKAGSALWT